MSDRFDILVIGAGIAGLAAAEEALALGLRVAIAEAQMFGGLVLNVNRLDPALEGPHTVGSDLAADMMSRVADLGVETLMLPVTSIDRDSSGDLLVMTPEGVHAARCVIVASGATLRKLGIPGEAELEHKGVAHCADCDGPMYRGQTTVVVGGGDSALQSALVLAQYCSTVHLVHRGAAFSAQADFVAAVSATPSIEVHLECAVDAIEGAEAVTGVQMKYLQTGDIRALAAQGFFAYVGLEPNIGFLPPSVEKLAGAVRVDDELQTSLAGVYAIGAVRSGHGGLLGDAVRDARVAVRAAAAKMT
jgi:thioredoxin reductase (NADPH)